jgi:hypothetical protein
MRDALKSLPNLHIGHVPTLVVIYEGGRDAEVYEGEKVAKWLIGTSQHSGAMRSSDGGAAFRAKPPPQASSQNEPQYDEDEPIEDEYDMIDDGYAAPPKMTMKEKKLRDIKDLARQMEAERKLSLGYEDMEGPLVPLDD